MIAAALPVRRGDLAIWIAGGCRPMEIYASRMLGDRAFSEGLSELGTHDQPVQSRRTPELGPGYRYTYTAPEFSVVLLD